MNDTVKLLKECDSGCKTAIDGMAQVLKHVSSATLRSEITASSNRHAAFGKRCHELLDREGEGKGEPPAMGTMMMHAGTGIKLAINDDDRKIAEMMADGANMGMQSLAKILNATPTATNESRQIANDIIAEEKNFYSFMLNYL